MRLAFVFACLGAAFVPCALSGCATADDAPSPGTQDSALADTAIDSGADAAIETGTDAAADTGADAAIETGTDAAADAAADTGADAGADAASDAGADAGAPLARIEELYADRNLNGDKSEFVEITAAAGTPLDTLSLRLIDATGKVAYQVAVGAAGTTMPSAGRWVVGANCVTVTGFCPQHVDQTYSITGWGLAGDLGAVQLVQDDGSGTPKLLDVVAWGGVPATPTTPPTKVVDGSPAPLSDASGHSIGRTPGAASQHDNSKDFCIMAASAGSANVGCL